MRPWELKGRTAVVIGAGALGMGAARALLCSGVGRLVVTNRQLSKAKEKAAILRELAEELGVECEVIAMAVDLAPTFEDDEEPVTIDQFVPELANRVKGDIDLLLVTTGGVGGSLICKQDAPLPEFPTEAITMSHRLIIAKDRIAPWAQQPIGQVYQANVLGPVELIRNLAPRLVVQDRPPVVMVIGSVSPLLSGVQDYAAAKLALREHIKRIGPNLATERRKLGLQPGRAVNIIWGFTESDQMRSLVFKQDGGYTFRGEGIMNGLPLGEMPGPEIFGLCVVQAFENPVISGDFKADGGFLDALVV